MTMADLLGAYLGVSNEGKDIVLMILQEKIAELMVLTAPNIYQKYVTVDKARNRVLHVKLAKALYG